LDFVEDDRRKPCAREAEVEIAHSLIGGEHHSGGAPSFGAQRGSSALDVARAERIFFTEEPQA
jgi:hypothetical protein